MYTKREEYMDNMTLKEHKRQMCACPECPHKGALAAAGGRLDMKKCAKCKQVFYCSRECQVAHWKSGHRRECEQLAASSSR